jgi:hypothetical protein
MKIGCGFNKYFFYKKIGKQTLSIPQDVSHLELGISELLHLDLNQLPPGINLSLHLARTPITEGQASQMRYIDFIRRMLADLTPSLRDRIGSIGIHLTGSRFSGAGKFGAADEYNPAPINSKRAISFINNLATNTNLEVWIENASIYSPSLKNTLLTWKHISHLCHETTCKSIIDLAHLVAESKNRSFPCDAILGFLPWESIAEIHLSGIALGSDGCMHDGHSLPIHPEVWQVLRPFIELLKELTPAQPIFTIEHTSPSWTQQVDEFNRDFETLKKLLDETSPYTQKRYCNKKIYMKRFLKYYLNGFFSESRNTENISGHIHQKLINRWIKFTLNSKSRLVFDIFEIPEDQGHRMIRSRMSGT